MTPALAKPLSHICRLTLPLVLCVIASVPGGLAVFAQQISVTPDSVSEDQIAGAVTSTTPVYTQGICNPGQFSWWINCSDAGAVAMDVTISSQFGDAGLWEWYQLWFPGEDFGPTNNAGAVRSAAYRLPNGRYLYAYQLTSFSESSANAGMTITTLTVPLGAHPPTQGIAPAASGVFVAAVDTSGTCTPDVCYRNIFSFGISNNYGDLPDDPITVAQLNGVVGSPDSITFIAPGLANTIQVGFPHGVFVQTPVFGFISDQPPRIVQGQFGGNDSGIYVPSFHMVVPAGVTMLDPVPDLLDGPKVTTHSETLATKGRSVKGVAADGVTEVVLSMPTTNVGDQVQFSLQTFASADDDGALGKPGDTEFSQGNVTVTSVDTSQGPMAFAVYRAPSDFAQVSVHGVSCASRTETLQIQVTSQGASPPPAAFPIPILRPPVVLVHGMWANEHAWDNFALRTDNCFSARAADYSQFQSASSPPPITASTPPYDDGEVLATASSDSLGFSFNTPAVFVESGGFLSEFS